MQVNRRVQRFGGLKNRPELGVVQVLAARVGVDDHTMQAQFGVSAVDLFGGTRWVLRGDCSQSGEPLGVAAASLGELVIGKGSDTNCPVGVEGLDSGAGERNDLPVDSCGVHVGEPQPPEVLQPLFDESGPFAVIGHVEADLADETRIGCVASVQHGLPFGD
jgi:hypothetical protein